jgi:hypothetical protein
MSNPLLMALHTPTCNTLDKGWKSDNSSTSLKNEWLNCVSVDNPLRKDPEWKELSDKEIQNNINIHCCNYVMQCKNPNEWLVKNKINVICPLETKPNYPHFGDIQMSLQHQKKMINTFSHGVL